MSAPGAAGARAPRAAARAARVAARAAARAAALVVAAAAAAACAGCPRPRHTPLPPSGLDAGAPLAAVVAHLAAARAALHTLRAVHAVALEIEKKTTLRLNGFLAVQYPDRFRLRATAFGGVTLFDLLHVAGKTEVLAVHPDVASKGPTALLWPQLGRDLALALGLEPLPPYDAMEAAGGRWILRAPGGVTTEVARPGGVVLREVREGRTVSFADHAAAGGVVVPVAFTVENAVSVYRADVEVTKVEPNVTLDPRLFPAEAGK